MLYARRRYITDHHSIAFVMSCIKTNKNKRKKKEERVPTVCSVTGARVCPCAGYDTFSRRRRLRTARRVRVH